jgi:anaerobic selenocysteine-containing dehydrogenase
VPVGSPDPDAEGRRAAGVRVDGSVLAGFPTPSGRLEFYSATLASWGWREQALPAYVRSHVHPQSLGPDRLCLISTFRLPVHIHTRSANAKWLDEIAHSNPLWIHPVDAARLGIETGDLVRIETDIGHFVDKAWVTEGIRPGVVACSHHMGRWKLGDQCRQGGRGAQAGGPAGPGGHDQPGRPGQRQLMATVALGHEGSRWTMRRRAGVAPYASSDPDTARIWWTDVGVHQNLTFPVHPDPVSGMHCWHQAVRVRKAGPGDRYGEIAADTAKAHEIYQEWLATTRPASRHSPDGTRRPHWLIRPLRPSREAYRLPRSGPAAPTAVAGAQADRQE